MRMNGKSGFAFVLIALGALLLIGNIGFGLGYLLSYLIPIALIILGYIGIKNGKKFIGWVILIIGAMSLIGKFGSILGFVVAAGIIMYGISLLKRNPKTY
jgi:lia operon protein LiaI